MASDDFSIKVLLVDDQAIVGETVRQMLAAEPDIEFQFCPDPAAAIDVANEFQPTVILQDLVMPDIDGLQLVKFFRANPARATRRWSCSRARRSRSSRPGRSRSGRTTTWSSCRTSSKSIARVRYHSRGYINLLERNEAYRELAEKQRELAAEVNRAARYVQSLLPAPLTTGPFTIDWKFVPSTQLAGDMFGYHWIDQEHLAIYLLDVSGHGVGSALLAVSAANVLSAGGLPGADPRDPGQVMTKLNDMFQMDRQDGKYFTIWYGVYRPAERQLAYCNAGHPPALLHSGGTVQQLEADGPAVGMVPELPYDTRTTDGGEGARLLVYSDGVFEVEKPDGQMWQYTDFVEQICPELGRTATSSNGIWNSVARCRRSTCSATTSRWSRCGSERSCRV